MTKTKLHISVLYFMLLMTITTIGFLVLQKPEAIAKANNLNNDNRVFFWEIYPELVVPNSGKTIDKSIKVKDLNGNDISIGELSSNVPYLVFRYSQYDCHLCIDQVLEKLKIFFEGNEHQVCLMVDGVTARDFKIKYKNRDIRFPVYFFVRDNLGLSLENKSLPFLFVMDRDPLKVDNIFVPFREHPDQTDAYLKNIRGLLND